MVDLRSLRPIDWPTVLSSVAKTGRAVIVQDAAGIDGLAATVAATIYDELGQNLHAPIRRLAPPFAPVPFAPDLERAYFVSVERIVQNVVELVNTSR